MASNWSPQAAPGGQLVPLTRKTLTQYMQSTAASAVALDHPAVDGDPVGQIFDVSPAAHRITAGSDTRRALMASAPSISGGWQFIVQGTPQAMVVENSRAAFQFVYVDQTFTFAARIRVSEDNTLGYIFDNFDASVSGIGCFLRRNANNTVGFGLGNGSGTLALNFQSVATLMVADQSIDLLIICHRGAGVMLLGNKTPETFTCGTPAAAGSLSTGQLTFGVRANVTSSPFHGIIATPIFANVAWGPTDIAGYRAYDEPRSSASVACQIAPGGAVGSFNMLRERYYCGTAANLYQAQADTTPNVADGNPVGKLENWTGTQYLRSAGTATAGNRPTWIANGQNGLGVVRWDGITNALTFVSSWASGAQHTWLCVFRQRDTVDGSDLTGGANSGLRITGSANPGNANLRGRAYAGLQTSGTTIVAMAHEVGDMANPDGFNVLCLTRKERDWRFRINNRLTAVFTDDRSFAAQGIGAALGGLAAYLCNIDLGDWAHFTVAHSDDACIAMGNAMAAEWGVPNVDPSPPDRHPPFRFEW